MPINYPMRKASPYIAVYISILLGQPLAAQVEIDTTDGRSNAYILEDWNYFAERTRNELLALGEKKYRRREFKSAVIEYYNFIYHFPNDGLVPLVHYRIGRSYEMLREFELARKEYEEVKRDTTADARIKVVCMRQLARMDYEMGLYDSVLVLPTIEDPYLLVLKGFASLTFENWSDSEQYFRRAHRFFPSPAQAILDSLIADLEAIPELDYYRTWKRSFVGLLPGGGHYYLGATGEAFGYGAAVAAMALTALTVDNWFRYVPAVGAGFLYLWSFKSAARIMQQANDRVLMEHLAGMHQRYQLRQFWTFAHPAIY